MGLFFKTTQIGKSGIATHSKNRYKTLRLSATITFLHAIAPFPFVHIYHQSCTKPSAALLLHAHVLHQFSKSYRI